MENTISFVVPVYNDGDTIERMVKSIYDQDLSGIEVIAVNDGSTDNSKITLEVLKEKYPQLTVIHLEKNEGACVARNTGAKLAKGKYLSFLPADAFLYPGMARIWYDNLEEHPDYDFLYGGYRIVDENGEAIPNGEYFFNPFDPYLLETTNYIDGSFPIRREAFWKYAEKMGQPDGLWDKNIISLQDWDFWLSVVKNGGKGIYVQDIFFETTAPHPGGLSYDSNAHWVERTKAIKKKQGIPDRRLCVASLGAGWHAKRIAKILDADFKEMPSFKPHEYDAIYSIGFYPEFSTQQDQMFFNNVYRKEDGRTSSKKIVHFVGTDIWQLYHCSLMSLKFWRNYFKKLIDVVLCEAEFTQKELKELGIDAQIVPIPPAKLYEIRPLPKEFTVAVYQPKINAAFYNPTQMREVAKAMPRIKFKFFGNEREVGIDKDLSNVEHCGYIDNMDDFITECSAIIRFPQHDGLPISVLEFLLAGRYSIQSVPIMHTINMDCDVKQITMALEELSKITEPNVIASDYWRKELNHDLYRQRIKDLAAYHPKEYWEKRAREWSETLNQMPEEKEEVEKVFKKIEVKSVLDIGAGDGRWYPFLKDWGVENYTGIDISENLIKAAQMRFPHLKDHFKAVKIEDYEGEKVDLVFSFCCLQHITEADFPKAVEAIKRIGKYLLLVEPMGFTTRNYCHDRNYRDYFKVIEEIKLKDKYILLCDLQSA